MTDMHLSQLRIMFKVPHTTKEHLCTHFGFFFMKAICALLPNKAYFHAANSFFAEETDVRLGRSLYCEEENLRKAQMAFLKNKRPKRSNLLLLLLLLLLLQEELRCVAWIWQMMCWKLTTYRPIHIFFNCTTERMVNQITTANWEWCSIDESAMSCFLPEKFLEQFLVSSMFAEFRLNG